MNLYCCLAIGNRLELQLKIKNNFLLQNAKIVYINKCSSHPENFSKSKHDNKLKMKKCGYNGELSFETTEQKTETNNKNKRKRNIMWYNPPFSNSVKTNINREFINLVKNDSTK